MSIVRGEKPFQLDSRFVSGKAFAKKSLIKVLIYHAFDKKADIVKSHKEVLRSFVVRVHLQRETLGVP